jgi:hypothetical protein
MGDDRDRCLSLGGGNCKYIPALLLRNDLRGKYLSSDSFSEAAMHGAVITVAGAAANQRLDSRCAIFSAATCGDRRPPRKMNSGIQ